MISEFAATSAGKPTSGEGGQHLHRESCDFGLQTVALAKACWQAICGQRQALFIIFS